MHGKRKNKKSAMIKVNAQYIKNRLEEQGGVLDNISEDMGYADSYLSSCLSCNRQEVLPVVLDYLVKNWGIDKAKALTKPTEGPLEINYKELSDKVDVLLKKTENLHRSFYEVQKTILELKALWEN